MHLNKIPFLFFAVLNYLVKAYEKMLECGVYCINSIFVNCNHVK